MVPPNERYPVWIPDFEAKEQEKGFERVETSVNEIAHEEVICIRDIAANTKQFHQVVELTVDISAYCNRRVN